LFFPVEASIVKQVIDFIEPLFANWGYVIIFLVALLEHSIMAGLAIPGDAVLLLGALYAGLGQLNIVWVIVLAFLGSVAGDNLGYLFGRKLGRPILDKHGDFMRLNARVLLVERYFEKYGGATIFIARFVTFAGTLASPVAGMSRMKYRKFLAYEVAGSLVWATGYGLLGYFFGRSEELIQKVFKYVGNTLLAVFILIALIAYIVHRVRKRRGFREELDAIEETEALPPESSPPNP